MTVQVLDRYIETVPGIAGGKPRIAGHRITIQNVVLWHEYLGMSADEIGAQYDLTLAEVHAALAYYFDHRLEIDRSIGEDDAFAEALRRQTHSALQDRLNADPGQ